MQKRVTTSQIILRIGNFAGAFVLLTTIANPAWATYRFHTFETPEGCHPVSCAPGWMVGDPLSANPPDKYPAPPNTDGVINVVELGGAPSMGLHPRLPFHRDTK